MVNELNLKHFTINNLQTACKAKLEADVEQNYG